MKSKFESNIYFLFTLFYFIVNLTNIKCKENKTEYKGRCLYLENDSGSKIIDFHKFTMGKNEDYKSFFLNEEDFYHWSINLCNDTVYTNKINNTDKYDSQVVWYGNNNETIRVTGPFYKNSINSDKNYISKENGNYNYNAQKGDPCEKDINYTTIIIYKQSNDVKNDLFAFSELPKELSCSNNITINFNIEKATDYLILQQILNDYFRITGIFFILFGIYLCFFSFKFFKVTKMIISLIFGQIIIFSIDIAFIGNSTALKDKLFILIIIIGLLIGFVFIYFSLKYDRLYLYSLAFSSGLINGIFVFDICFVYSNCILSPAIFVDVILIFIVSFISLVKILPRNYIYYPPVIGSYILMRGISLLVYNLSGNMRFIDLQLLLYLVRRYEDDLINQYLDGDFNYFWIYIILNAFILILSEIINHFLNKNKDFLEKEKEEDDINKTNITELNLNLNSTQEIENENSIDSSNIYN